jgi:hypothetical protein
MSKKKQQTEDIYDLIAGALPENEVKEEPVKSKEEDVKYNNLSYVYAAVKDVEGRINSSKIVEIAFDLATGYCKIERVVEENKTLPVALNKCEEYNYMVLFLNRRRP